MSLIEQELLKTFGNGSKITVCYSDRSFKNFDVHTRIGDLIVHPSFPLTKFPIVGVYINNELKGLGEEVFVNVKEIVPLYLNSNRGMDIYQNSLRLIFFAAINMVCPNRQLSVFYSLDGGVYYEFLDNDVIKNEDYLKIEEKMQELVKAAYPINIRDVSWEEAYKYFVKVNRRQTVSLLDKRTTKQSVRVVICDNFSELFQHNTPFLPNTALLSHFSLAKYIHTPIPSTANHSTASPVYGIVLRFPTQADPFRIGELPDRPIPLIYHSYQQNVQYLRSLNVGCVGDMNALIANSADKKLSSAEKNALAHHVLVAEAYHDRQTVELATAVATRPLCRVVCIAGPSSSGKTTFAHKLAVHLRVLGKVPTVISLDNFYLPYKDVPRDAHGEYDFEAPEALDLPLVNRTLVDLIAGKETVMPRFDMRSGQQLKSSTVCRLGAESVVIVESIHGLNDKITEMVSLDNKYRIFIAPLTQLNLDDTHRLSPLDTRLLRRITRDYQYRGYSAEQTLLRWPSVRWGEEQHILPTMPRADALFDSGLDYELFAMKAMAEPLLRAIAPASAVYPDAQRLLSVLADCLALDPACVPPTSLLREFIGNSPFYQE